MNLKLGVIALALVFPLAACASSVDWADPDNPLCLKGHYEADYDKKKVKDGTEQKRVYNSVKKRWETKTVTKYKTVQVYDGQDWVCDEKQAS